MKKQNLPVAPQSLQKVPIAFDLSANALNKWESGIKAEIEEDNTISILDPIGLDYWTGDGVTAKRIAAALRQIGHEQDVTVYINSPGGDMFEGFAIYNLLRNHGGKVTVKIIGIAASAASIIAMSGDDLQIARAGFLMIHNCWLHAVGNRHDFREVAETIEPFDLAMTDIYAIRSGLDKNLIISMMDKETYIVGNDAVEQGFADSLLPADIVTKQKESDPNSSIKKLDALLAKAQLPRTERRKFIQELKTSMSGAASESTPCAASDVQINVEFGSTAKLSNSLKGILK
ncbi:Clp protease ClpP [Gilliamella apicola]|uniref:ATP-dependent Clp protease proteolytic subunit n=1 Tax=Gilliamella apicola TaxID=1196095 RepID=A0A556RSF7_9GAMM|nr:head maturation protease, ClpP-related [Gilliamella apicola]TSJ91831.1 Clp protease ClpP [Gilliamella apicola]